MVDCVCVKWAEEERKYKQKGKHRRGGKVKRTCLCGEETKKVDT